MSEMYNKTTDNLLMSQEGLRNWPAAHYLTSIHMYCVAAENRRLRFLFAFAEIMCKNNREETRRAGINQQNETWAHGS